jgi:hypothetical protein
MYGSGGNTVTVLLDIIHHPVFYLKQRVGDRILAGDTD